MRLKHGHRHSRLSMHIACGWRYRADYIVRAPFHDLLIKIIVILIPYPLFLNHYHLYLIPYTNLELC
jgi:hypothetical protein